MAQNSDYHIKLAERNDLSEILEMMRDNYYYEERMFSALSSQVSMTESDKSIINDNLDDTIKSAFALSPCLVAIDNRSNKIIGVNLTSLHENSRENGDNDDGSAAFFKTRGPRAKVVDDYFKYLIDLDERAKIFYKFSMADSAMEFYAIAVDKSHRKKGVSGELLRRGISLARDKGIPVVYGVFTSPYSTRSAEKIGMKKIMEFDLLNYVENGKQVFSNSVPHNIVNILVCETSNFNLGFKYSRVCVAHLHILAIAKYHHSEWDSPQF